jgi:hypothetical protein
MEALKDEEKQAAGKPAALDAVLTKEKQLNEKYYADLRELDRQSAENKRKEDEKAAQDAEKARKQTLNLAKLASQDELNLQKTILEEKDRALDQDLAYGRINEAQWVAMKKAGITQELRAQMDALDAEQKAAKDDLVAWTKIQNQKDALNRKAYLDMGKVDIDFTTKSKARWDSYFDGLTSGFNGAIKGLINGTKSWGDAWKDVVSSAESAMLDMLIQVGMEEAKNFIASQILHHTTAAAKVADNAAEAGTAAAASAAEDGPYGWAIAIPVGIGVAAAAMGMFSAEGGWDRVPSDQVAQLHQNEMVLPSWAAEGARKTFAAANEGRAPGGGNVSINITAMDGQDVHRVLTRHQDSLFRVMREGSKNGRLR